METAHELREEIARLSARLSQLMYNDPEALTIRVEIETLRTRLDAKKQPTSDARSREKTKAAG